MLSLTAFSVVRPMLSPTMRKPLSTSLETFRASIAINTTYMRLIIFWRGDTGLFLIAIILHSKILHSSLFTLHSSLFTCEAEGMFVVMASIMRA